MKILNCFYFIAGLLLVAQVQNTPTFDLSQVSMQGSQLQNNMCNKDTVIDLKFNAGSQLSGCASGSTCSVVIFLIYFSQAHHQTLYHFWI